MFEIRKAIPAELTAAEGYYNAHIEALDREKYKVQWRIGAYPSRAYLKSCIEAGELWIGVLEGEVVAGMVLNHSCNEGYSRVKWSTDGALVLHTLGVRPDCGGQGFAKQMLRRAMDYARECGEPAIRLDVRRGNAPARGLYEKMGFRYVQTERMYYADMGWGEFDCFEWICEGNKMIDVRIIDSAHREDINLPNEPFALFGRMLPSYTDGKWSYATERAERVSEMCFPDESYDYDAMSKDSVFIGAYDGEKCVGLAIMQEGFFRYMYLYDLKVNAQYRGKGVAAMLLDKAREVAREKGCRGIYTQGQDNNLGACLFYIKYGFRIGGLDTEVYKGTAQEGKSDIIFYLDVE